MKDHPRSRGEYGARDFFVEVVRGSSPLSRGIPGDGTLPARRVGIIPALAGNTTPRPGNSSPGRDHPRSRGEYCCASLEKLPPTGSSPLSRGIRAVLAVCFEVAGIIPALAGNTGPWRVRTGRPGDHPRSRGEYDGDRCPTAPCAGSSPLSRGIRSWTVFRPPCRGIIPALAGNTSRRSADVSSTTDHPRSRGEYRPIAVAARRWAGSSPLSRGIRGVAPPCMRQRGIIPALAGNTQSPP